MTKIKICGITNKEDAIEASRLGVDLLGFIFYSRTKRYVEPKAVMDIVSELPRSVAKVGVFVDEPPEKVLDIAESCSLDVLQFHGDEGADYCARFKNSYKVIKAFRIRDRDSLKGVNDYETDFYLLDTYSDKSRGGTGKGFDHKMIEGFEFLKPVILSGGLTPANVAAAIQNIAPYGVDVSSGVEKSPGKKDHELMKKFVENTRRII